MGFVNTQYVIQNLQGDAAATEECAIATPKDNYVHFWGINGKRWEFKMSHMGYRNEHPLTLNIRALKVVDEDYWAHFGRFYNPCMWPRTLSCC